MRLKFKSIYKLRMKDTKQPVYVLAFASSPEGLLLAVEEACGNTRTVREDELENY